MLSGCKLEKLKGLCRTRWVERHEAYENFKELFPAVIMTMDMICHPHMYNNPSLNDWAWDRETKDKANGIASCLKRFENIASFVVQKSALYPLKGIAPNCNAENWTCMRLTNGLTTL